jgi:hypothetical protein
MEGLGETLRDQQDLADDTFGQAQEEFRNGEQAPGNQPSGQPQQGDAPSDDDAQPGQGGPGEGDPQTRGGASPDALAERQRALADALREQQLQPLQRAMEDAADALEQGDSGEALSRQSEAMDAMREGLRAMNEAATQDQREQAGGDSAAESGNGEGRDPLGRARNQGGDTGTEQDMLAENDMRERARDLLDELRRRSAELDRPEEELDYLRRLLDRF